MKKLLFALLAILLAVVATFAKFDRADIKEDATYGRTGVDRLDGRVDLVEMDVEYVKRDMKELKGGQKTIVKGMQKILDTLYTLPSERRRSVKPVLMLPAEDNSDQ